MKYSLLFEFLSNLIPCSVEICLVRFALIHAFIHIRKGVPGVSITCFDPILSLREVQLYVEPAFR